MLPTADNRYGGGGGGYSAIFNRLGETGAAWDKKFETGF